MFQLEGTADVEALHLNFIMLKFEANTDHLQQTCV